MNTQTHSERRPKMKARNMLKGSALLSVCCAWVYWSMTHLNSLVA